jgi:glycosyltransferase involved in cell wall biosynthesis
MFDATGVGGVARTVNMLASSLASTHEVHVHSLLRNADDPRYALDPRVEVHWLIDNRHTGGHRGRPRRDPQARRRWRRLDSEPSALEPDPGISAYTDALLRRELSRLSPGVLVSTRPMLHLAAAKWAPDHVLRIAQDHLNFELRVRNHAVMSLLDEAIPQMDAFVTLTEADRGDYLRRYGDTLVERIPNASPYPLSEQAPLNEKVVVSAGRLVGRKGFDRLIEAWAPLAREFPDWQVHIYGEGERRPELERLVTALGVGESVRLPGYTHELDHVLARSALFAMSSRGEGFPMVLLEAMAHGLPLVSFDCPRGPAEIIGDGVNGRLVEDGDIPAYTRALRDVIVDKERRSRMGRASHEAAKAYQIAPVSAEWEQLFAEVLDRRVAHSAPVLARTP